MYLASVFNEFSMKILLKNIKTLVQVRETGTEIIKGNEMKLLPCINNAYLAIENGIIVDYGTMEEWGGILDWRDLEVTDCEGKMIFPSWVDSHTHLVYASSREQEFVDRINGLSYQEIANRGGGILNSVEKLRLTSEDDLFISAEQRLLEIMHQGTGAVEIKSGYGLDLASELKMLRVVKRLKSKYKLPIKATFLGAHAVPTEFQGQRENYITHIIEHMLPAIVAENLADYCDIFCETNYFTPEDTIRLMEAAKLVGLTPKVHANQLHKSGGVQAGVACNAISVDHLEFVGQEEIKALQRSSTMPTLLPGAQLFLGLPCPPAREMIDNNLPLALASDYNPGSSPTGNMQLMVSLATILYKMTPEEAINAATINSAYAMGVLDEVGSITVGKKANFFITKAIPSIHFLPYSFGSQLIESTYILGEKLN